MQKSVAKETLKWQKGQWNRKVEYIVQVYRFLKERKLKFNE